ncbi:MAG: metal-sensitive transcriptional regulator [Dictyoglomus turgidum]|uniref:metal-sensitive transcriptional regulator n=1 Tax=Dictyoglomus turgidum TaxID=513050 RepID=UPI003C78CF4B
MDKKEYLVALRRIEGQVRGLQRMIEEERDCKEIISQIAAVRSALKRVGILIVEEYAKKCIIGEENAESEISELLKDLQSLF